MAVKRAVKKIIKAKPTTRQLSIKKAFSKSETIKSIAEVAELGKKQATIAMDWLAHIIKAHISKKGPGVFVFPDIAKFKVVRKCIFLLKPITDSCPNRSAVLVSNRSLILAQIDH
ncbi:MAG: hypothetical protein WCH10_05635 [bacterium]